MNPEMYEADGGEYEEFLRDCEEDAEYERIQADEDEEYPRRSMYDLDLFDMEFDGF